MTMVYGNNDGIVVSTNISEKKGTIKYNVNSVILDYMGIIGDAHRSTGHRQISFLDNTKIKSFGNKIGKIFNPGDFGENLTIENINNINLLDTLKINNVILKITQLGKTCHGDKCSIYREVGKCLMPIEGFFSQVIVPGKVNVGDFISHDKYTLKILVITLSDRASKGIYADTAGAIAKEILEKFLSNSHWNWEIQQIILPDNCEKLTLCLKEAINNEVDIIFTLGGTGISQNDITYECVSSICDKFLPNIISNICLKFANQNPLALLSRSIVGITKKTQIYTLPGSTKAVAEYMQEILKTMEHIIFMLHSIDNHNI